MQDYQVKYYGCHYIAIEILLWVDGFFWCFFVAPCIKIQVIISLFHLIYKIGMYFDCFFGF